MSTLAARRFDSFAALTLPVFVLAMTRNNGRNFHEFSA
jgi:hypothetical protein